MVTITMVAAHGAMVVSSPDRRAVPVALHRGEAGPVRPEHDIQGNHRSEAPACHRCGLPLLDDAEFCPYCERFLDEGAVARLLGRRRPVTAASPARRVAGVPERLLLLVGAGVFTLAAIASVIAALAT